MVDKFSFWSFFCWKFLKVCYNLRTYCLSLVTLVHTPKATVTFERVGHNFFLYSTVFLCCNLTSFLKFFLSLQSISLKVNFNVVLTHIFKLMFHLESVALAPLLSLDLFYPVYLGRKVVIKNLPYHRKFAVSSKICRVLYECFTRK